MTGAAPPRRVAFAGTPEFARTALAALLEAGFDVPLVLTQPDRPAGRGLKLQPSPVKQLALAHGVPVAQPRSLRLDGKHPGEAEAGRAALQAAAPDVLVVAAYGLILPPWALDLPPQGCVNIHGSLLPRWRGAAPVQRALEAGDAGTGTSIMRMDAGLDTGPVLLREALPIAPDETAGTLFERLAAQGARLLLQALRVLPDLPAVPQTDAGACYAAKIDKAEAAVDWSRPAAEIERRLRAFDPVPGCSAGLPGGDRVKLWRAEVVPGEPGAAPGTVLHGAPGHALVVACGGGSALRVLTLQLAGGRRSGAAEVLRALPALRAGAQLG